MLGQDASVMVDGQVVSLGMTPLDPLARSALISLFTWRRADTGDVAKGEARWGWWGDTFADSRIGSRLYLLAREKITPETIARAREYIAEALQWMLDDGVASNVSVTVERAGLTRLDALVILTRADGTNLDLRFSNLWTALNV